MKKFVGVCLIIICAILLLLTAPIWLPLLLFFVGSCMAAIFVFILICAAIILICWLLDYH